MLWERNLTDEDYFVRGFYFGNDPRDNYLSKGYTQLGGACTCWRYYKLGFLNYFRLFSECKKVVSKKLFLKRAIKSHLQEHFLFFIDQLLLELQLFCLRLQSALET